MFNKDVGNDKASSVGLRHSSGVVFFSRVLWSEARSVAVEIVTEAPPGVQSSVRPFALTGEGVHSGLDAGASESVMM